MSNEECISLKSDPIHPVCVDVISDRPEGLLGLEKLSHEAPLTLNREVATSTTSTPSSASETRQSDAAEPEPSTPLTGTSSTGTSSDRKHGGRVQPSKRKTNTISTVNKHGALDTIANYAGYAKDTDDLFGIGKELFRVAAGSQAFRQFNWLTGVVGKNSVGTLSGMVLDARARIAFLLTEAEHLLTDAEHGGQIPRDINISYLKEINKWDRYVKYGSWAAAIVAALPQARDVIASRESPAHKGAKLAAIGLTEAQRAYAGVVPLGARAINKALEGYCMTVGLVRTGSFIDAAQYGQVFRNAGTHIQTTFDAITDAENQWWFVNTLASPRTKLFPMVKKGWQYLGEARDGLRY